MKLNDVGDQESGSINEGNFRELLRFRVESGDDILRKHLETMSSRATYISKTTQNELVNCIGEEITAKIVNQIKNAKYFSVMFDETTDVSHVSQMSIVIRYVHENDVREDFIAFLDCHEENYTLDKDTLEPILSGKILGQTVLKQLKLLDLNLNNCVGICTDGCSVMTSEQNGAVQEVKKGMPVAVRCPCYNHALNLALSKTSNVQSVRNLMGTIKEISAFFTASSKRHFVLKNTLDKHLHGLCETRWVEWHECILQFKNDFDAILDALEKISLWNERDTASKAKNLMISLTTPDFILTLYCLSNVLSLTLPLSNLLQDKKVEKNRANEMISCTLSILTETQNILKELDVELTLPRLTNKMRNRSNPNPNLSSNSPEDYYRISLFIPLLDCVINDLESRFSKETINLFNLNICLPLNAMEATETEIKTTGKMLSDMYTLIFVEDPKTVFDKFKGEFDIWKLKWTAYSNSANKDLLKIPADGLEALQQCDESIFPVIYTFLKILCTLPISVASSESVFRLYGD
ncbi:52 kDa repressor of the inhibitor of the protein kinase-like [Onthophagus taurus]|uniref:52 kDa repressor of the inhibitor of the protein kinase-like n=1 Tax=Onthophagus taurus TaxID=166361 RepID=UPI0039BDABBB